ncbi:MAG: leucyl aminopeptidase, partial [Nocardioides sp.]
LGPEVEPHALRKAAGTAARAIKNAASAALALPSRTPAELVAVTEGWRLGGYRYTTYKSSPGADETASVSVLSPHARSAEFVAAFERVLVLIEAVWRTRDLINMPPGDLRPPDFAGIVAAACEELAQQPAGQLTCTVYDEEQLADLGCGGILGVGQASGAPPRLVELTWVPTGADKAPDLAAPHLALVGKGITFDSGGLAIKPAASMKGMKQDMGGAAAVVHATLAIAKLGVPVRVSTFVPMAENMVDGNALRPGDVVHTYRGKTIEVSNTDAEGRLILADALGRAVEVEPDAIVDVATLTGHMVMSLGDRIAGLLGNDDALRDRLLDCAEAAGEHVWPMPIPEEMHERVVKNTIADVNQHDWARYGGGLYAAAVLEQFVESFPWAHLDIAGPAFHNGGATGHITPGGTGFAVATLVALAESLAE